MGPPLPEPEQLLPLCDDGRSHGDRDARRDVADVREHHSRAISVCQEASLTDPEIIELCEQIVQTQQEEINQMKKIITRRSAP